jgi:hypothetical protein
MASQAQIDANRSNAQFSTGPRTEEGKAAVSRNAFRHGLRSKNFRSFDTDPEYYDDLCRRLLDEYEPASWTEEILVERIALCQAKLGWMENAEGEMNDNYDQKEMVVIWRRMESLERSEERAIKLLHQLQKERKAQEAKAPVEAEDPAKVAAMEAAEAAAANLLPVPVPRFLELMALGKTPEAETSPAPGHPAGS